MVVEGFTADQAANAILAVLAPKIHAARIVSMVHFVGESEPSTLVDLGERVAGAATAAWVSKQQALLDEIVNVAGCGVLGSLR